MLFLFVTEQEQCSIRICLTWKVSANNLTLICKVDKLKHILYIDNQFRKPVADCFKTVNSTQCEPTYSNSSINIIKSEAVFIVQGKIDHHINGKWRCRHGGNRDLATVDVTVLTLKG